VCHTGKDTPPVSFADSPLSEGAKKPGQIAALQDRSAFFLIVSHRKIKRYGFFAKMCYNRIALYLSWRE
jgi:hypothetical protein